MSDCSHPFTGERSLSEYIENERNEPSGEDGLTQVEREGIEAAYARRHTIPVAFTVEANSEEAAALALVQALSVAQYPSVPGPIRLVDPATGIEDWRTPNHPSIDGSDDEGERLVWVKHTRVGTATIYDGLLRAMAEEEAGRPLTDTEWAGFWDHGSETGWKRDLFFGIGRMADALYDAGLTVDEGIADAARDAAIEDEGSNE